MARFLRSYPNVYAGARPAHSRLNPPVVVGKSIAWYGPGVVLAAPNFVADLNRRRRSRYELAPPTILAAPVVFIAQPIKVAFADSLDEARHAILQRNSHYLLRPPVIVNSAIIRFGPRVFLTRIKIRPINSGLQAPTVVNVVVSQIFFGPKTKFAPSKSGITQNRLSPPIIIGSAIVFRPTKTELAYSSRGKTRSRLFPPVTLVAAVVQVFYGPKIVLSKIRPARVGYGLASPIVINPFLGALGGVMVSLAPSRRPQIKSSLRAPVVVGVVVTEIFFGPKTKLTFSSRGTAKSKLNIPIVIGSAIVWYGPGIYLVAPRTKNSQTKIRLSPPSTVEFSTIQAFYGPITQFALNRISKTINILHSPTIIDSARVFAPIKTNLTLSSKLGRIQHSKLSVPIIIGAATIYGPVLVHLAYSKRGRPINKLAPPTAVIAFFVASPLEIKFAYSKRGRPESKLFAPTVVGGAVVFRPVETKLAPSTRGIPHSKLQAPTVVSPVFVLAFINVTLASSSRGKINSLLSPPAIIDGAIIFRPLQTKLTYSRRGITKSKLNAPTIINVEFVFIASSISVNYWAAVKSKQSSGLSRRLPVSTILRKPIIIGNAIAWHGPGVYLIAPRSKNAQIHSRLIPPAIIAAPEVPEVIFFGPIANLALSKRGKAESKLNPPTVVDPVVPSIIYRPIYQKLAQQTRIGRIAQYGLAGPAVVLVLLAPIETILRTNLVPSHRGKIKSYLSRPTVVNAAKIFAPIEIKLVLSKRGKSKSFLAAPITVASEFFPRPVQTHFTYSLRGVSKSKLRTPVIIGAATVFAPIVVHSTYSKRGRSISRLSPPIAIVALFTASPIVINLAPFKPGKSNSKLFVPTVVSGAIIFRSIYSHLSYSRRGKSISKLYPPQLIAVAFTTRPIQIHLAYSRRGIPKSKLRSPIRISAAVVFSPINIVFASRKPIEHVTSRASHPILRKPIVVSGARIFRPIVTELTYSRRGKPISQLNAPIVIGGPFVSQPIFSKLALSSRLARKPYSKLRAPIVVSSAKIFRPIKTNLASQKSIDKLTRQQAKYKLRAPVVVTEFVARAISITLVPSHGGVIKSRLIPPAIIAPQFFARSLTVSLAPSSRGIPKSQINPPVVIGAAIVFRPISTRLAKQNLVQDRLVRAPQFRLAPPTVIFVGKQKGYHSRTKINSRESTLIIVLNRATSDGRINDRESDLDIS